MAHPKQTLTVVFIHGFKGTDATFSNFPSRLKHILSETLPDVDIECIVFPAYETKGELVEAVEQFTDWLVTLTVQRECSQGTGGGAGTAHIVLCGHSMGGLVAADTILNIVNTRNNEQMPLWPKIVACIAFDTPYLGLHPAVFKNSADKAVEVATAATSAFGALSSYGLAKGTRTAPPGKRLTSTPSTPSPSWGKWAPAAFAVGGALLAGAVGTAYYKREEIVNGYTWATDHMKYIGNLWDQASLTKRLDNLLDAEEKLGVRFQTFYVSIPPTPPTHPLSRTFIILPPTSSRAFSHFHATRNNLAPDEVHAHTDMFEARSNDGYYDLGVRTAKFIRDSLVVGGVATEPIVTMEGASTETAQNR